MCWEISEQYIALQQRTRAEAGYVLLSGLGPYSQQKLSASLLINSTVAAPTGWWNYTGAHYRNVKVLACIPCILTQVCTTSVSVYESVMLLTYIYNMFLIPRKSVLGCWSSPVVLWVMSREVGGEWSCFYFILPFKQLFFILQVVFSLHIYAFCKYLKVGFVWWFFFSCPRIPWCSEFLGAPPFFHWSQLVFCYWLQWEQDGALGL